MRRRFSRGRRGRSGDATSSEIDAPQALAHIAELGVAGASALEPVTLEGVPAAYAALGTGEGSGGDARVVGYSPRSGGDALLAALALAGRRQAEEGFRGEVVAVAPQWSIASRRRLAWLGSTPFEVRAVVAPALAPGEAEVEPETAAAPVSVPSRHLAGRLPTDSVRDLFLRALTALEGLAAKHGGVVRGVGAGAELVLLARRVAALRADPEGVELVTYEPQRSSAALEPDRLATALDKLEGTLRKRLADRRVRGGEEGLRSRLAVLLADAAELREPRAWPLGGSDREVLDVAGLRENGRRVAVGVVREHLTLAELGAAIDAAELLRPSLLFLFAGAEGVVMEPGPPELLLAAEHFDDAPLRVLASLGPGARLFDVRAERGQEPTLAPRGELAAPAARRPAAKGATGATETTGTPAPPRPEAEAEPGAEREPRRGRRRRGGRRGGRGRDEIVEVSLFDLDDDRDDRDLRGGGAEREDADEDREGPSRRRRRGRRGRSRRRDEGERSGRGAAAERDDGPGAGEPRSGARPRQRGPRRASEAADSDDDELAEGLAPLTEEVPELEPEAAPEPGYDDEEEGEEADAEADRLRLEREARRRARIAKAAPTPEPERPRPRPRRAALVAHADRDSLLATVLLARDVRLVEGLWVYPQSELMTFFRSVATDLREETPIYVVGFTASPVRDTLQAASLYRERLGWFDHHDWPPEDLEGLRAAIGEDAVHVLPGAGSSMPAVLSVRGRRSRFSDKLVDLAMGRFSEHDYERWGRLWWHRLGEIASQPGERRSAVDALLVGRPSELAREAKRAPEPPLPPEAEYVSGRDFRLVHFGGHTLVALPVPPGLDLHLAARIARERYRAPLSVAWPEGGDLVVLGTEDVSGRRILDLGAMAEHLAAKHEWIEAGPDTDHVARLRVRDLPGHPERLDDVIGEIAMGRSILEG